VDLVVTGHGLPTIAAAVAFVLGTLNLFGATNAYSWTALIVLVVLSVLVGVVFLAGSSEVLAARGRSAATGVEGMIGEIGTVVETVESETPGWVFVHGERWRAVPAVPPEKVYEQEGVGLAISAGRRVQVVGVRDGKVVVLPLEPVGLER
jgi:membrane-bound serine protease (ClpP class)